MFYRIQNLRESLARFELCRHSRSLGFYLFESTAIRLENCLLPGELLPAFDHHVDVLRIELHSATDALS